jgi:hypothetical protein
MAQIILMRIKNAMLYDTNRQFEQHFAEQKMRMRDLTEAKLSTLLSKPVLNWKNSLFIGIIISIIIMI